jgi:hypothetical protein
VTPKINPSHSTPENTEARPSASSASAPKSNPANGFAASPLLENYRFPVARACA